MKRRFFVILASLTVVGLAGLALADDATMAPMKPAAAAVPMKSPAAPRMIPMTDFCYELSRDGKTWPKEPQQLCIKGDRGTVTGRLQLVLPTGPRVVSTFDLSLSARARCSDCNKDAYTLDVPAGSPLALGIAFHGKRDPSGSQKGTVNVFGKKLSYRLQVVRPAAPSTR
jgi:hypothetical protein